MSGQRPPDLVVERPGRRPANIAALAGAGLLLAGLWAVGAHPALLVVAALPAAALGWEVWADRGLRFELTDTQLAWQIAGRGDRVPLEEIAEIRLKRRLDMSRTLLVRTRDGRVRRIPAPVLPEADALEEGLRARGITLLR